MSIASVITLGYGQGVQFLPTIGYLAGDSVAPTVAGLPKKRNLQLERQRMHLQAEALNKQAQERKEALEQGLQAVEAQRALVPTNSPKKRKLFIIDLDARERKLNAEMLAVEAEIQAIGQQIMLMRQQDDEEAIIAILAARQTLH